MIRTPEQRQIARWIENHYDIDKVQCAEVVTKPRAHHPDPPPEWADGPDSRGGAFRGGRLTSCQYCTPREE